MANTKSADASLWWSPFPALLTELENAPVSSDLSPHLLKKLKESRAWFIETLSQFKKPSEKSREALNSQQLKIGSHELTIKSALKDKALQISAALGLDEVQSYILVERSAEHVNVPPDSISSTFPHQILLEYYIERQCLLKCTRQIFVLAYGPGGCNAMREEAQELISAGLDRKLVSILEDLFSSTYPEKMDVDLFTLWAEETLNEENLILEILFLIYYEPFCTCDADKWKKLCLLYKGITSGSCNFDNLAVSAEALDSSQNAKVQLLFILIETLDLESLLQMVHDEKSFRPGLSAFSLPDIQEMDAIVSSMNPLEVKDAGPLFLAWAVFVCLVMSLFDSKENSALMDIDHVGYVRQAFEAASLNFFLDILQNVIIKESYGSFAGYRSVLRTFISAFIASYEINNQLEDSTFNLVLDILCKIYRGEESLCMQFWDRESFIDGPIRCLLCNVEGEFPHKTIELVRLLSSLCDGHWPAECVYNFLDKSVGISSIFEISDHSLVDDASQTVETNLPLHVPGIEGLEIPSRTRGHILRVIGRNVALVRWEYAQSGIFVLLLRLTQQLYRHRNEEVFHILDLLNRMLSFNTGLCFPLMNLNTSLHVQSTVSNVQNVQNMWAVEVISSVFRNLHPSSANAALISLAVNILAKMLKCSPSNVAAVALKVDVASSTHSFISGFNGSSSSWFLSGNLAKMLLIDCEHNDYDCTLAISVLEFTNQLLESGQESDAVHTLLVFCLQYILVNHEYWKYKVRHIRWIVTLKVLELVRRCIMASSYSKRWGEVVQNILLSDSSVHNTFFRIVCTTLQALEQLYINRLIDAADVEGLELATLSVLDVLHMMISRFSKDTFSSPSVFHQALLSSTIKPIPVAAAVISLISYFRNPAIQVAATRVLSSMLIIANELQHRLSGIPCFSPDDKQIAELRNSLADFLEQPLCDEDLFLATVDMLTSAARFQPAFLLSIIDISERTDARAGDSVAAPIPSESKSSTILNALLHYIERSAELIKSKPEILLVILNFLKALWEEAAQYPAIIEQLKSSGNFWKHLSSSVSLSVSVASHRPKTWIGKDTRSLANSFLCQAAILETMACGMFLHKKLLLAESLTKRVVDAKEKADIAVSTEKSKAADLCDSADIFVKWSENSVLQSLVEVYSAFEYDGEVISHSKVAAGLFAVHVMGKLTAGDSGSLSIALLDQINALYKELRSQPAFSELLVQYSQHRYSEGKELESLVLNDLYYHLQGEFEGRNIGPGPFKELFLYLARSDFLQNYYEKNYENRASYYPKDIKLFDTAKLRADMRLDLWDYSDWKGSKVIAETLLQCMEERNWMMIFLSSQLSVLKALPTLVTVYDEDALDRQSTAGRKIIDKVIISCINQTCESFQSSLQSLAPTMEASEDILKFLASQADLIIHLIRKLLKTPPLSVCLLIMKTSGSALKVLGEIKPVVKGIKLTLKLALIMLLLSLEFSCSYCSGSGAVHMDSVKESAELSNSCLGHLPILCSCLTIPELGVLSLTAINLVIRNFLMPNTWFPIIQARLPLHQIISRLHDKNSPIPSSISLNFLLTLARVRGGAEMLLSSGLFSSLRALFTSINEERNLSVSSDATESHERIWGLSLAVIAAIIHSLGDSSSCISIVNSEIPYFFTDKAYLVSYYLSAPYFPSDDQNKKRPRGPRTHTSLSALKETEHVLTLMCVGARHWSSWVKAMKEMDPQLREKSIHLLAFISRGNQQSLGRNAPLLCPPVLKSEMDECKKSSFVNSKNGWFSLAAVGCFPVSKFFSVSTSAMALVVKDRAPENSETILATSFSDTVALQIYRIAFLILKFLCLQAEGAANRAGEVGFIDLAHFPELPMPEILHGMQDQAISIVTELSEAGKAKRMTPETQSICLLLLQVMEMALYLELCVLHICGIRPVLGRVEDFSKEIKPFLKAVEAQDFLKPHLNSLKRIVSLVYPGLLQADGMY